MKEWYTSAIYRDEKTSAEMLVRKIIPTNSYVEKTVLVVHSWTL